MGWDNPIVDFLEVPCPSNYTLETSCSLNSSSNNSSNNTSINTTLGEFNTSNDNASNSVAVRLATTTRYCDGTDGACGYKSNYHGSRYTAAPSPGIFGDGTWCGSGCSKCFKLKSIGNSPLGEGKGGNGEILV